MKKITALSLFLMLTFWIIHSPANACSCNWQGPFLTVAKNAPLVVRGRILRHHPGQRPTMDVLVLETLSGGLLDSGIVVQMGDGMHCRPNLESFPSGSEWILALNGPGSKPGDGLALSHCGEYWLRIENNNVNGTIDGAGKESKQIPVQEFRRRFLYPRFKESFHGLATQGGRFRRSFGSRFEFILEPATTGWEIVVREYGRDENLARLTPPLHFVPNPREIEGWHLMENPKACFARPYKADSGPDNPRRFIFSPEVGVLIDAKTLKKSIVPEDIEAVRRFGQGALTIGDFKLLPKDAGCMEIEWMKFSVQIEGGY